MVHKSKVLRGISAYVDNDLVPGLAGSWKAWALGAAAGLMLSKGDKLIDSLSKNPVVNALGMIEGENIDVESVFAELRKQAQRGNATLDVPMIGPITFGASDVESLYRHIMGA